MPNPKSTAQISGHPIHPMLIPGPSAIIPNGLLLSLVAVLLLLFSGWKGGDLVFRGHVGVADN